MQYTITKNAQFNSIEISFTERPADSIREALMGLRLCGRGVPRAQGRGPVPIFFPFG